MASGTSPDTTDEQQIPARTCPIVVIQIPVPVVLQPGLEVTGGVPATHPPNASG